MSLGIAGMYSSSIDSDGRAVELIHRALDLGVTLLDTANIYGDSELKVGQALRGRRSQVFVATKFGIVLDPANPQLRRVGGRPEYVRACCERACNASTSTDRPVLPAPRRSADADRRNHGRHGRLVVQGKVRLLGLSEAAVATHERATGCIR